MTSKKCEDCEEKLLEIPTKNLAFTLLGAAKMLRFLQGLDEINNSSEYFCGFLIDQVSVMRDIAPVEAFISAVEMLEREFGEHPQHRQDIQFIGLVLRPYYENSRKTREAIDSIKNKPRFLPS